MITIITRWESSQMPAKIEWQMWRQLRGAFKVKRMVFVPVLEEMKGFPIRQFATMEEAVASCPGRKVFLEPTGPMTLSDLDTSDKKHDLTLVLGNTAKDNMSLVGPDDYPVGISTPQRTHLYGINAAAIALAYWVGQ